MRLAGAILILVTACQSQPNPQTLDVALAPKVEADPGAAEPSAFGQPVGQASKVSIPWQQFFKPPPLATERSELLKKIKPSKRTSEPKTLLEAARAQAALGQLAAAEVSYRQLLRLRPEDQDGLLELAQLYLRMKQLDRCFELLKEAHEAITAAEASPRIFVFRYRYTLALAHIARGERTEGQRILGDLIAIDREFVPGYAALAASYLAMERYGVADFIVRRGLDQGGEDPALCNLMGVLAEKKGNLAEARRWLDKALEKNPSYAPALVNRAKLALDREEHEAAESDLIKALQVAPAMVEVYALLGIVQKRTGRYDGARQSFAKAMEIDPENGLARYNLALLMTDQYREPSVALRLFHEVLQSRDENWRIKDLARAQIETMSGFAVDSKVQ